MELLGNQLNALVTEGSDRVLRHVLVRRQGKRNIVVGSQYTLPDPTRREGVDGTLSLARWKELLVPVPPPQRDRELTRAIAWTSPLNSEAFLEPTLEQGYEAWRGVVTGERADNPVVMETDRGPQPYPFPLASSVNQPTDSLLSAFELCSKKAAPGIGATPALAIAPTLLRRLEDTIEHAERRITALRAELDDRADPDELRALGDLILARFSELPSGAATATLTGFDGAPVELRLDPTLPPHENAASYYDRAARSERAARRIPRLLAEAQDRHARWVKLRTDVLEGSVTAEEVAAEFPSTGRALRGADQGPTLPYRSYRSSGGLEIRVGRGAKHNDDLTFRHSAPNDVWLHARHTAGAHVILRWSSDDNPPARDLEEAGVLAALHSKARTSRSVPIDWTRRKHVRKPRGSKPGSVVPDRVRTVFVTPDEALAERLSDTS